MHCTIGVAKTEALISCAVTAQLICAFVFAYAFCWFSDAVAEIVLGMLASPVCQDSNCNINMCYLEQQNAPRPLINR